MGNTCDCKKSIDSVYQEVELLWNNGLDEQQTHMKSISDLGNSYRQPKRNAHSIITLRRSI